MSVDPHLWEGVRRAAFALNIDKSDVLESALSLWFISDPDKRVVRVEDFLQLHEPEVLPKGGETAYIIPAPEALGKSLMQLIDKHGADAVEILAEGILRMEEYSLGNRNRTQPPDEEPPPNDTKRITERINRVTRSHESVPRKVK